MFEFVVGRIDSSVREKDRHRSPDGYLYPGHLLPSTSKSILETDDLWKVAGLSCCPCPVLEGVASATSASMFRQQLGCNLVEIEASCRSGSPVLPVQVSVLARGLL